MLGSMTEYEFRLSVGTWELNPKSGLEITATLRKGVWMVKDACSGAECRKPLFKGMFDEAYRFYESSISPNLNPSDGEYRGTVG